MSKNENDGCDYCDTFGGKKTYANQACLPLNGRVVCVDWCIHQIVAALNAGGIKTVACCCGHGRQPGRIDLADGRVLTIAPRLTPGADAMSETNDDDFDPEAMMEAADLEFEKRWAEYASHRKPTLIKRFFQWIYRHEK